MRETRRYACVGLAGFAAVLLAAGPAAADANGNYLVSAGGIVKRVNSAGSILKATAKVQCDPNDIYDDGTGNPYPSHPQLDVGVFQGTSGSFGQADNFPCDNTIHTVKVTLYAVHAGTRFKAGKGTVEFNLIGSDATGSPFDYVINRPVTIK